MALTITIPGAVETTTGSTAPAVLTVGVGAPGQGVPSGGSTGQYLVKASATSYDTAWLTLPANYITSVTAPLAVTAGNLAVNLSAYLAKSNNLSDIASASTARTNLGLGTMATATASDYAALAGATFTGEVSTPASTTGTAGFSILPGTAPTSPVNGEFWNTGTDLQVRLGGVTETLAEQSWVTSQGYLTSSALTPYAPLAGATFTGLVGTVASTTATAGLNVPHGVAPTSPVNGDIWTTTGAVFARINAGTKQLMTLSDTQTVSGSITFSNASQTLGSSTATGTINVASGATISAATKTLNIGTGGIVGSTTTTILGPVLGASTTTIGATTAASTLNLATGATLTSTTKAVNIGTAGVSGSTTNIAIGGTAGTSTTTLNGTTNGVTAAADTNSVALATTAYVVGQAGSATPLVDGTAAVGTSLRYSRQDHVHPTDTSRAALASPTFTGTPSLPTGSIGVTQSPGNNTTALATTAFVTAAVPAIATIAQVYASTSATTATPPLLAPFAFNSGGYFPRMNFTTTTSGTGASVGGADHRFEIIGPNVSTAGFAQIASEASQMWSAGTTFTKFNFSKPVWLSFRMCNFSATYDGDAQTEIKAFMGDSVAGGIDPVTPAVGIFKAGGSGSFINLMVHNGTTLTKVATTTTFNTTVIDVAIYSNNGTVTLYLNGVSAATTSLGPTADSNTNKVIAAVKATATASVRQILEIANIKVFAPQ